MILPPMANLERDVEAVWHFVANEQVVVGVRANVQRGTGHILTGCRVWA
jgi:hypothetical protein